MDEINLELATTCGVIRGVMHMPCSREVSSEKPILLVHGYFSANRVGPARLYVELARWLCKYGFRVFRPDLLGVGDSDGRFQDISLDTEMRDLRTIISWLLRDHNYNQFTIVAHSMGANVSLRVASEYSEVSKLILVAPDIILKGGVDRLFDDEQIHELRTKGWTLRKGLHINNSFVQELRNIPVLDIANAVSVPITIIQGSEDELYEKTGAESLAGSCFAGKFIEIERGDHNFLLPESRLRLFEVIASECSD